jgi:two-component system chemotaxis response regulator CheB
METTFRENDSGRYVAVVMGASAGGLDALGTVLAHLTAGFALPVIIAQHVHPVQSGYLAQCLDVNCPLPVREAEDKSNIDAGIVYVAPPNYHLLVEDEGTLALSVDERVQYSRPSIDVLFESAADIWGCRAIGVLLTGANRDGAAGLRRIRDCGGLTIAQDPATAEQPAMPQAAIDVDAAHSVLALAEIGRLLARLGTAEATARTPQ